MNNYIYYGVIALSFALLVYSLDSRGRWFTVPLAVGCAVACGYGLVATSWSFAIVEAFFGVIALRRARNYR